MAHFYKRHGDSGEVNAANAPTIFSQLVADLRSEYFAEPDDEHPQVSVGNEHWSVTACVSGLIIFDNIDLLEGEPTDLPESMYLRDIPDHQLFTIWHAVVLVDRASLLEFPWATREGLASYSRDFYRQPVATDT